MHNLCFFYYFFRKSLFTEIIIWLLWSIWLLGVHCILVLFWIFCQKIIFDQRLICVINYFLTWKFLFDESLLYFFKKNYFSKKYWYYWQNCCRFFKDWYHLFPSIQIANRHWYAIVFPRWREKEGMLTEKVILMTTKRKVVFLFQIWFCSKSHDLITYVEFTAPNI